MLDSSGLQHGDLAFANTSIIANDYMVGFVEQVDKTKDCVVIREIGTDKLCNYYNETFSVINKDKLGLEILVGLQYETYQKVLKAFGKYTSYGTRFKSLYFDKNKCFVEARKIFSNDSCFEIEFTYNSKTTIKSIGELLKSKDQNKTNKIQNANI